MPLCTHVLTDSPVGPLTMVATDGVLSGLYMTEHRHQPPVETFGERRDPADSPSRRSPSNCSPTSRAS